MSTRQLSLLFFANGIFVFAGVALVPIYALFAEDLGASLLTVSYLATTLFVAKAAGTVLMRLVGDTVGQRKYWLIAGFLIRALGWALLALSGSVSTLFMIQVILGFSEGIGSPAFRALVATNLDRGHEVANYADWEIILAVAGIFGTAAGGYIATTFGFPTLFMTISGLAVLAAVVMLRYKTPTT